MTSPPAPLRNTEALSTCRVGEEAARPGGFCDKANQRRARQLSLFGPEGAEHEASPVAVLELPYPGIARVNDPISKAPAQPQSAQQDCLRPSMGSKPCRHHGMTAASAFDEAPTTAANDQTGSLGETCCPAVLSEMVRTSSHAEAGIDATVILEAPATRLPWVTRRNMTARALICLDGGDLWLAELKGHPWSAERLGQLADVIRTPVKFRADKRTLEQRAEDALQLPGVVVRRPSLDDMDARAWSTRPIAVALLLAHAVSSSTQVDSADVQELTGVLDTALRAALATLKRALDPQAQDLQSTTLKSQRSYTATCPKLRGDGTDFSSRRPFRCSYRRCWPLTCPVRFIRFARRLTQATERCKSAHQRLG